MRNRSVTAVADDPVIRTAAISACGDACDRAAHEGFLLLLCQKLYQRFMDSLQFPVQYAESVRINL